MTTQINQLTELTSTSDGDLLLIRESATGVDKKIQAQNLRAKATTKDDVGLGNVPNLDTTNAVAGNFASVNIDGGTIDGTAIGQSSAGAGAFTTLEASGDVDFDSGTLFVDASENKVGIGTTSPSQTLEVSGNAFFGSGTNAQEKVELGNRAPNNFTSSGGIYTQFGDGDFGSLLLKSRSDFGGFYNIKFYTASSNNTPLERMRIASNGNVGIGTTSPSEKLHVNGDIRYNKLVLPNWEIMPAGVTPTSAQVNHAHALFGLASQRGAGWSVSAAAPNGFRYSFLKTSDNSYIGWTFLFEDPSALTASVRYNRVSGTSAYKVILEYSLDNGNTWQVLQESPSSTSHVTLSGSIPAQTEGASIVSIRTRYSEGTVFTNDFNGLSGFNISGKAKSWQIVGSILGS